MEHTDLPHLPPVLPVWANARSLQPYTSRLAMLDSGRLEKNWSWLFMIFSAAFAEEMTRAGTRPSCTCMTGPCFRASLASEMCGCAPSWWRLPRMGSLGGHGGRFEFFDLVGFIRWRKRKRRKERSTERATD
ncbi:hypothetical protein QJS10_CPA16g00355 [Acorus calamus]|uniref:Uncharacterized protein n=1 Tax=Acorus calamus TaxID=4465 RepID=A0AAV9D079_ACOCL|nr:hypothetical protein QJS10_CPA16g00355 [Acorus calamus]